MIFPRTKNVSIIRLSCMIVALAGLVATVQKASDQTPAPGALHFRKQMIASESFETIGVFDVNKDGAVDLVSGAFWYQGPDFLRRYFIGQSSRFGEYYNDFSTIPMDFDADGWMDFITAGWTDTAIYWRRNPGNNNDQWKFNMIGKTGNVETTRSWDLDKDGVCRSCVWCLLVPGPGFP